MTLEVIENLRSRHDLTNAQFKLLHHGASSLGKHVTYCEQRPRFDSETNALVCLRLLERRGHLDQGASWDEAIARSLEKYPLPPR